MRTTGAVHDLVCPRCGGAIAADDVNLDLLVGLCRGCNATVELTRDPPEASTAEVRERPPASLLAMGQPPSGITAASDGQRLVLRRRWFELSGGLIFLALWTLVWDGFLVIWYALGFVSLFAGETSALLMLLFPILHLAVGVGITYSLLATVVNRSTIVVDRSHLRVEHGPLPWGSPEPIPLKAIDQLYLVRKQGKNSSGFDLVARRTDRTSETLLSGLSSDVQGRYLEHRIESHLGLADVDIEGEYSG